MNVDLIPGQGKRMDVYRLSIENRSICTYYFFFFFTLKRKVPNVVRFDIMSYI